MLDCYCERSLESCLFNCVKVQSDEMFAATERSRRGPEMMSVLKWKVIMCNCLSRRITVHYPMTNHCFFKRSLLINNELQVHYGVRNSVRATFFYFIGMTHVCHFILQKQQRTNKLHTLNRLSIVVTRFKFDFQKNTKSVSKRCSRHHGEYQNPPTGLLQINKTQYHSQISDRNIETHELR